MKTDEKIRLAALKLKQSFSGGDMHEWALKNAIEQNPEEAKLHFRNICATIPTTLFDKVETHCSTLSISKREFVEMALVDLIQKTNEIVNDVAPFPEAEEA
jgi:hypothetical protein